MAVEWTAPAIADLYAIDDYWSAYAIGSAERVLELIETAAAFLSTMPSAGPLIERSVARKWRVAHTSYLPIYRIRDERIEILRVRHGREDWMDA